MATICIFNREICTQTHTHRKGGRRREEDNQSISGKTHKKQVTVKQ